MERFCGALAAVREKFVCTLARTLFCRLRRSSAEQATLDTEHTKDEKSISGFQEMDIHFSPPAMETT
jgi:hypothetical protein